MPSANPALALIESDAVPFSTVSPYFDRRLKRSAKRWTLLLPGTGCPWKTKTAQGVDTGRCTFCGFLPDISKLTGGRMFSPKEIMEILHLGWDRVASESPDQISVFNGGNFTNDREIHADAQLAVAQWVAQQGGISSLLVENRPEFCKPAKIRGLTHALGDKTLVVAIGLESSSDEVLRHSIDKGYGRAEFERAIGWLRSEGADVSVYVFLKPLFLTELQAIEDTVRTIVYAQNFDPFEVAVESAMVVPDTIMEDEYRAGRYRPPWIWSVVEVVRRAHHLGPLHIGAFQEEPPPVAIPTNYGCGECDAELIRLLREFTATQDPTSLLSYTCTCQARWQRELDRAV